MNQFLNKLRTHPELFILLLMAVIVSMLVIPLPTYLVDFLIGLNIVLSALVFLSSFYIDRILSFSTFPSVLLITTLFRLALSVSTTRLILNEADAGEIIATFGQFVIGDNLVVGFVIFAIVTIVNFMVITKGAERVAEVAARFSLDGMPGKQMSIDADLRAGSIDAEGAKERRSVVERESQLYGSFDGAMKFIKGDAISGIIIIFINLIGGIGVGMSQHGMDMSSALTTYTILTIGDGLVGQIPALLISISAGFIVTRVNGDGDNMGRSIIEQLTGKDRVLIIAAIIALCIGFLPGFPLFVFLSLSALLAVLYLYRNHRNKKVVTPVTTADKNESTVHEPDESDLITNLDNIYSETIPLLLLLPDASFEMMRKNNLSDRIRSQFYIDYGINLPELMLKSSSSLEENMIMLMINEIKADQFQMFFDKLRVVSDSEEIQALSIPIYTLNNAVWVDIEHRDLLKNDLSCHLRTSSEEIYASLVPTLMRHINEYFGVQETKNMLDKLEEKYPDLMKEVTRHATVQRISDVLQRLLSERISVRNMKLILESIAQWAPREKDVIMLVEHIRGDLSRYICHKFASNNNLRVLLLSHDFEDSLRQGIRNTSSGAFLNLEPGMTEELYDRFTLGVENLTIAHKDLVVLSSVDVRRFLKKFLEKRFKELDVISYAEITENVSVDVIRTI